MLVLAQRRFVSSAVLVVQDAVYACLRYQLARLEILLGHLAPPSETYTGAGKSATCHLRPE